MLRSSLQRIPTLIQRQSAFTLVELSVVLVIIGLLVAGVLAAQDMIRAAEVRATVTQVEQYRTSIRMFEDKYGGLPGDLPNATNFWSSECTDSGANTCNGNHNGFVIRVSLPLLLYKT